MEKIDNIFNKLNGLNVSDRISKKSTGRKNPDGTKNELSYLSWSDALEIVYSLFEEKDVSWIVFENPQLDNLHIFGNSKIGYYVKTQVTIKNESKTMTLPVTDASNRCLLDEPYEYTTTYGTKCVDKINAFEINTSVMRCLVKNIALFGIGLYIYKGEDLPTGEKEQEIIKEQEIKKQNIDKLKVIIIEILSTYTFKQETIDYLNINIINNEKATIDDCEKCVNKLNEQVKQNTVVKK